MEGKKQYYYVYIISNKMNGIIYIGMTNNLKYRMYQHKNKTMKGYSSRYSLNMLVYYEKFNFPNTAIKREKQLKKWNRAWKINLINDLNPEWKDLTFMFNN
ncbi:GIY-YIG nuclease family protein [Hwangdonia lutea]|uniref:GIY-YIG nuclease family protein n=1 Tax=Hwangdonia lutea TaxID=3075823 RepID=A0AA97HQ97_9FLAO|nr:GIY-YIG nuclease family protein [Hwangdonia sp. SCSIO 19198]WOD42478.1 GIY-YIG nuclease family protein [Hwangdonia sp. SCSIO 19198]